MSIQRKMRRKNVPHDKPAWWERMDSFIGISHYGAAQLTSRSPKMHHNGSKINRAAEEYMKPSEDKK